MNSFKWYFHVTSLILLVLANFNFSVSTSDMDGEIIDNEGVKIRKISITFEDSPSPHKTPSETVNKTSIEAVSKASNKTSIEKISVSEAPVKTPSATENKTLDEPHEDLNTTSSKTVNGSLNKNSSKKAHVPRIYNTKARVLTVLVDSSPTGAKIIADVINYENSPAAYTVHLTDCSNNVPVTKFELAPAIDKKLPRISNFSLEKSHVYLIPPRRTRPFIIDLDYRNSSERLQGNGSCLLNVFNRFNEKLHTKLIQFSPNDSCICNTNCKCSCFEEDPLLECIEISDWSEASDWKIKNGNSMGGKAGALESASNSTEIDEKFLMKRTKWWNQYLNDDKHIIYLTLLLAILIILLLLLLGALKGLLGCCCFPIGRLGLKRFYDKPRLLDHYYEGDYEKFKVIHDAEGYPLDPFTRARSVKRLNPNVGFCLNMVFFLCCPVFCMYWLKDCCFRGRDSWAGYDNDEDMLNSPSHSLEGTSATKPYSKASNNNNKWSVNTSGRRSTQSTKSNHPSYATKSLAQSRVPDSVSKKNVRMSTMEGSRLAKSILATASAKGSAEEPKKPGFGVDVDEEDDSVAPLTPLTSKDLMYPNSFESSSTLSAHQPALYYYHAEISPDPKEPDDDTPVNFTPLTNSSALLDQLTRKPHELDQPLRKRGQDDKSCCGSNPYGSWHRTPSIFNEEDDGESRFDLTKTTKMSRRKDGGACLTKGDSILR